MASDQLRSRVRAEYDAIAARYEQRWGSYVRASTEATLRRIEVAAGDRVLDVGCGTGLLLARLHQRQPSARLAGIDLSPGMVAQARARLPREVPLLVADAEALPFPAGSFDVVVSASSFHLWPTPGRALEEVRRVLGPRGMLVITDWCDDYLACRVCDRILRLIDPAHQRIYGRAQCGALLAAADYEVRALDRFRISWFWGLMTAIARKPPSQGSS